MNHLMPKTNLGKWAVGLIITFFLLFAAFFILVASGQRGPDFNPMLALAIIPAGISGICAFFTGIIGIVKSRERSILVFISCAIGLFVLLFCLGEFLSPH
jgi:tellurite resistance protein TehA-like permease